ncbi:hypothetical protein RSW80_00305 [Escherichia coli]|uniref:hypothetical protein n=1 Tax=Escherichia coli TaxID=562 RepID=UPI0028DDB8EC|nr:hypothetical protein [Escherichia coli]MDT9076575.1 hypothetical protein [Escherichia coli]
MTDMHGQNGMRLLAQLLATRFHEASHCAGFLLCKAHRTVATADKVIIFCLSGIWFDVLSERPCLKRKKPRDINSGLYLTSAFIHR